MSLLLLLHRLLYRFLIRLRQNLRTDDAKPFRERNPRISRALTSRLAPAIGASLAGFTLAICPDQLRLTAAIYWSTRSLEFLFNVMDSKGWLEQRPWWFGSWLLMPVSCAQLFHAFVLNREATPRVNYYSPVDDILRLLIGFSGSAVSSLSSRRATSPADRSRCPVASPGRRRSRLWIHLHQSQVCAGRKSSTRVPLLLKLDSRRWLIGRLGHSSLQFYTPMTRIPCRHRSSPSPRSRARRILPLQVCRVRSSTQACRTAVLRSCTTSFSRCPR